MSAVCTSIRLADGHPCPYCGVPMTVPNRGPGQFSPLKSFDATREHVFPASQGGRLVIIACLRCNAEKADRSPYDWIEYLYDTGDRRRAERTIRSYCLVKSVFPRAESADQVIDLCQAFLRQPSDALPSPQPRLAAEVGA